METIGKKKQESKKENDTLKKTILAALIIALFAAPVYGQTGIIINEDIVSIVRIDTTADAPFNQTQVATVDTCGSTDGTTTSFRYQSQNLDHCNDYFGFNISTWDRDKIADVVFNVRFDSATCAGGNPTFINFAPKNGTLDGGTFNGLVFNDSLITSNQISNASLYPQALQNSILGYNKTELMFCAAGDFDRGFNVTNQFAINYDRNLVDSWTVVMARSDTNLLAEIFSRESSESEANLTISQKLFRTVEIETSNSRYIAYDFERNRFAVANSSTIFDSCQTSNLLWDFVYDTRDNILRPCTASGSVIAPSVELAEPRQDLENTQCAGLAYSILDVNDLNSAGGFERVCFELEQQHDSKEFFGVFQMVNSTCPNGLGCDGLPLQNQGRDTQLFITFISPDFFNVQFISIDPQQPEGGDRVLFRVQTTELATAFIQYRTAFFNANFTNQSVFSPWFTINGSSNGTAHEIPLVSVEDNKFYQFFTYAIDNTGARVDDNNTDSFYNFTVGAAGAFTGDPSSPFVEDIIPNITEQLGIGFSDMVYVLGMVLLIMVTAPAWRFGGEKMGLGVGITMFVTETVVGLLPFFLLIPILVILAVSVTAIVMKKMGS